MSSTTDLAEPIEGIADFLRQQADRGNGKDPHESNGKGITRNDSLPGEKRPLHDPADVDEPWASIGRHAES
eukprot:6205121-Pyramimonas_sp.AAC.1